MNDFVTKIQEKYLRSREESNYTIFAIEEILEELAKEGVIWCIKDMTNLTLGEDMLISFFLFKNREKQIYDSL